MEKGRSVGGILDHAVHSVVSDTLSRQINCCAPHTDCMLRLIFSVPNVRHHGDGVGR